MNLNLPAFFFCGLVATLLCFNTASGSSYTPIYTVYVSPSFDDNWLARSRDLESAKLDILAILRDGVKLFRKRAWNATEYKFKFYEPIKYDGSLEIGARKGKGIDYVRDQVEGISRIANIYLFMTNRPSPQDSFVIGASSKIGGVCSKKSDRVALVSWYKSSPITAFMAANTIGGLMTAGDRECMRCKNDYADELCRSLLSDPETRDEQCRQHGTRCRRACNQC